MKTKISRFIAVSVAVVLSVGITSCSGKKRPDVIITYSRGSLCLAPIQIAAVNGYFKEEFENAGYTFDFVEVDTGTAPELIAAGKADASATLSASNILPIQNGLNITFTGGLHTGCTKYFVKKDSTINSVKDLKGKKIGVISQGDSATINIKRILAAEGFKVEGDNADVQILFFPQTDLPLALENGAIDLAGMHDPVAYKSQEAYGFKTLIDTLTDDKFSKEYCCQSYVTTDLVRNKPEAAAAYTRAILKGAAFVQANPEETARIQIENHFVEGDPVLNGKILKILNYNPGIKEAKQTIANITNELKEIGLLNKDVNTAKFVNEHFTVLSGVPESYIYNGDGTFTEIWD
ncbi:MAG: ABC transporter substrate-binding protein [Treponemataceae bacterium]|nr:ABC transporter substrate-binding protein [Treponemataceae bacterium]